MSVLIYAESWEGSFRKSTFEAISYANEVSKLLDTDLVAISFGNESKQELEKLLQVFCLIVLVCFLVLIFFYFLP